MGDMPKQTYYCQCKGCKNGEGSAFEAAPEAWFKSRGLNSPKNCPSCRFWIKFQKDERCRCNTCNRVIKLPARYKISHHKYTGEWYLPNECLPCERGMRPPKSTTERKARGELLRPKKNPKREPMTDFRRVPKGIRIEPRPTLTDPGDYAHWIRPKNKSDEDDETRLVHLAGHILNSEYSQVGQRIKGRNFEQTATAFGNDVDFEAFIDDLGTSMMSTDPLTVREQQQGNSIVRYTLMPGGHVEKTVLRPCNDSSFYEVITSHDDFTVEQVKSIFDKMHK